MTVRATGKRWRNAVDDFIENHESRQPFHEGITDVNQKTLHSELMSKRIKWNVFYEREELTRFMDQIGTPPRNPILGRAVSFEFQEETELDDENFLENSQYWPTVFKFLSNYGDGIWYCNVGAYGSGNSHERFMYLLRTCLTAMPNLKTLHIFGWINEDAEVAIPTDQLAGHLEENPFPVLPHLELLELDNMSGLPSALQHHLLTRYSQQLKGIQISEWNNQVRNLELPLLTDLTVDVARYHSMDRIDNLLSSLSTCPIGRLNISFSTVEANVDMHRLFELMSQYGDTLRTVCLTVIPGYMISQTQPEGLRLRAPGLRALHLEGFDSLSLSFLKDLPMLECLELRPLSSSMRKASYPNETIDLYDHLHFSTVYDSRIWKDVPKLRKIFFEICNPMKNKFVEQVFTRDTYDYLARLKESPIC